MLLDKYLSSQYNGADYQGRRVYNFTSGGGGGPTTSTTYTTNLPEVFEPMGEALIGGATQEYFQTKPVTTTDPETGETKTTQQITGVKPFVPYSTNVQDYIAGFSPLQQQAQYEAAGMQRPGQFGYGTQLTGAAGAGALDTTGRAYGFGGQGLEFGRTGAAIGQRALGYGSTAAELGAGQFGAGAGQRYAQMATDPRAMQSYMSPYMQNVVDTQKQAAIRDYQEQIMPQIQSQAVKAGAFGGSRDAVQRAMAQRNLASQLQGIQATGTQKAFEEAQRAQQFGADIGMRGIQTGIAGQQAGLQGIQGALAGTEQGMRGAQLGLQGVQAAQAGYGMAGQMGRSLADIGTAQQASDIARMDYQSRLGGLQQQREQQLIDQAIKNYQMAREHPYEQLSRYSGLLRGYYTPTTTQTTYQAYNPMAQFAGTAAQAYGAYKGMGFKEGGQVKAYAKGGILDAKVFNNPTSFSPEMINKGMQNDSISDVIGAIGLSQIAEARKGAQQSQALSKPAPEGTVLSDLQQQAMGIETLPSGLPAQGLAKGGIIAFSGEDDSLVRAVDEAEMQAGKLDRPGIDTLVREATARRQAIPMSEDELEAQKFLKSRPEELAKQRQMDRYMALMRFGAGMAGAKTRNFAQALSEGTTAALPVLAEGEKAYRTGITEAMRGRAEMGRAARAEQLKGLEAGEAEFRSQQDRYSREETSRLDRDLRKYISDNPQDIVIAKAIQNPNESLNSAVTRLIKMKQTDEKTYNATAALFGRAMENTNEVLKKAEEPGGVLFRLRTNLDWAKENYPDRVKNQADALRVYQEERNAIIKQEIDRFKETTNIDPSQLGRASGFGARTTPSTRSSAGPQEGQTSKDVNGKPIVYKNGQWVYQ